MLLTAAGPHRITGNGVGFKPDILDMDIMEKVLEARNQIKLELSSFHRIDSVVLTESTHVIDR